MKIAAYLFMWYALFVTSVVTVLNIVSDGPIMSVASAHMAYGYINAQLFGIANCISDMVIALW